MDKEPASAANDELDERGLLRLWRVAQGEARHCCGETLRLLRRGEGGFYQAEDFWQDLFLEFWDLARQWRASPAPQEQGLFAIWRRRLWGSGWRVRRRLPQRLWLQRPFLVDPRWLDLEDEHSGAPLSAQAREALVQPEEAEATQAGLARIDEVERALWALTPAQRALLYLAAVAGMESGAVAHCLGLENGAAARYGLFKARQALRQLLEEQAQPATQKEVDDDPDRGTSG